MLDTPITRRGRRPVAEFGPNPIDVHVGSRVRLRRTLLGMSQEKLGEAIGLTFQQVQKYERGANRISASMLYKLSSVLDVPVSFFYDDMDARDQAHPTKHHGDSELERRESLELARTYAGITDPVIRLKVRELIRLMASTGDQRSS